MKLVDTNVLVYAVNVSSPQHNLAKTWLDKALGDFETIGFPWLNLIAFVRLTTNPRIMPSPLDVDTALNVIDLWLSAPCAVTVTPGAAHTRWLREKLTAVGRGGDLINDAHIAALAQEQQATVVTFDSDFALFPGVTWSPPLNPGE